MSAYRPYRSYMPAQARFALIQAEGLGFKGSCRPEVGRLLRSLALQYRSGTVAEIGTGCGVGTAWVLSGLDPRVRLVTIEIDPDCAAVASRIFEGNPNVRVRQGDWHQILEFAPFEMVFCDAAPAKRDRPEVVLEAVRPGGLVVLDDFTPEAMWTPEQEAAFAAGDPVRDFWLGDPRLIGAEVLVAPDHAVVLAVRR